MKKLMIFAVIACMLLSFAACDAPADTNTPAPSGGGETVGNQSGEQEKGFAFTYKGTEITMHAPAAPIIKALGEPVKYTQSTSCAFEGLDKSYYYGSFYLDTYPKGQEDFVYGWWFADDSVSTEEGIYIGSPQADVEKAYGAENFNGTNAFVVKKAGGILTVILENGVVNSIQYAIELN
jgi:hypothetical protein